MSQTDSSVAARQHVSDPFRLSIGFDADDTLWHCERDFDQIQQRFGELLAPWMERDTAATSHLEAIERRNLEIFGYGVKGFTLSMVESAIQPTVALEQTRSNRSSTGARTCSAREVEGLN